MSAAVRQQRLLGLLATGRQVSMLALAAEAKYSLRNTAEAMQLLVLREFVERSPDGGYSATTAGLAWHESDAPFPLGPASKVHVVPPTVRGTLRQRVWTAMRLRRRWTINDLLTVAAKPSEKNAYDTVQKYVKALCGAGIVAVLPKRLPGTAPTSNGANVYSLVRNTGEIAPTVEKGGTVRDRNEVAA